MYLNELKAFLKEKYTPIIKENMQKIHQAKVDMKAIRELLYAMAKYTNEPKYISKLLASRSFKQRLLTINTDLVSINEEKLSNVVLYAQLQQYQNLHNTIVLLKKETLFYKLLGNICLPILGMMIRGFNTAVSNSVLMGNIFNFDFGIGRIYIMEYKYTHAKVYWKESFNNLHQLALEKSPQAYNDYKNKFIKLQEYLKRLSEYTYSHENPQGRKWVYVAPKENALLWTWHRGENPMTRYYRFKPSNGINTETRLHDDYFKTITCERDILDNPKLGNIDKLSFLIKYNPYYKNRHKYLLYAP